MIAQHGASQHGARQQWQGVIAEYRDRLPVSADTPVITLREGGTPLLAAPVLSARTGCEVYLKVEGGNPTGSFKDRGMTVAISVAAGAGAKAVICASTGNTSASAAAYAARAGLTCAVLVPRGKIAIGKLAQALVHGARLLQVEGSFDDCLELARKLAAEYPVALVNSVNPDRLQGQKTAAFEIVDELGDAPDVHCLPVGNAGNITAYWMGYTEYRQAGHARRGGELAEYRLPGGQQPVGGEDLPVGDRIDPAARLVAGRLGQQPGRRVADPDRGRDRLRLQHAPAGHDRRRAAGLEPEHPRRLFRQPGPLVLGVSHPVRGDVPRVADGQAVHVGRVA